MMKILVDELPEKCKDCDQCLPFTYKTALDIDKTIDACLYMLNNTVPKEPGQEPPAIDPEKAPVDNNCYFMEASGEKKKKLF